MVDERLLEQRLGPLWLALGGEEQSTTARAHGKAPWNLRACGARLELRHQRSGALEVCRAESAFDRVSVESPHRRLPKTRLCECLDRRGQMGRGGPRVAGRELGETERALPQHAPDRFPYAARLQCGGTHRVDAAVVRVDVRAPDVARARTDARQPEELVCSVAQGGAQRSSSRTSIRAACG